MSMKNESTGMGTAYFSDGHTEVITEFEISKDYKDVWFTVESGQNYVYREEREYDGHGIWHPTYKFYKHQFVRHCDTFGPKWDVEYLVTNEIERIKVCVVEP